MRWRTGFSSIIFRWLLSERPRILAVGPSRRDAAGLAAIFTITAPVAVQSAFPSGPLAAPGSHGTFQGR
jgi:hypothetical protein